MCTVNVRGSGHRVFPSFQRSGCTKEVPYNLSIARDRARKNRTVEFHLQVLRRLTLCHGRSCFWMLPQRVGWLALRVRWRVSYTLMSKRENCRIRCLECEKKCASGRKNGDTCSLTTNQSHQHSLVVKSVSCVVFYTIVSSLLIVDSVQLTCIESRLKSEFSAAY